LDVVQGVPTSIYLVLREGAPQQQWMAPPIRTHGWGSGLPTEMTFLTFASIYLIHDDYK
jgi:hypothetical protein